MNQNLIVLKINQQSYRFTNGLSTLIIDGFVYSTANFDIGDFSISESFDDNKVNISFSKNSVVYDLIKNVNKMPKIEIEIFKYDSIKNKKIKLFDGYSLTIENMKTQISIEFTSKISDIENIAIKRYYQRTCSFTLYDNNCTILKSNHVFKGTITEWADDYIRTSINKPDNYFQNGFITFLVNGIENYAHISSNDNEVLYLDTTIPTYVLTVNIYQSCNKTIDDCFNKFNNHTNFGGFPFLPFENPSRNTIY